MLRKAHSEDNASCQCDIDTRKHVYVCIYVCIYMYISPFLARVAKNVVPNIIMFQCRITVKVIWFISRKLMRLLLCGPNITKPFKFWQCFIPSTAEYSLGITLSKFFFIITFCNIWKLLPFTFRCYTGNLSCFTRKVFRDARDAVRGRDGYSFDGCRLRVELTRGVGPRGPGGRPLYAAEQMSPRRRAPPPRRSGYRVVISGLPASGSWQDLKVHRLELLL